MIKPIPRSLVFFVLTTGLLLILALAVSAKASDTESAFASTGIRDRRGMKPVETDLAQGDYHGSAGTIVEANTSLTNTTAYTMYMYLPLVLRSPAVNPTGVLAWPIDCIPGETCSSIIGYPDIDGDGLAFNCAPPGYPGHEGTDIDITWEQMDSGVSVFAAADGQVLWVFDGKYDRCPGSHPDCQPSGYIVCTEVGDYCGTGSCCCFWCFAGSNVIVIRHFDANGVFATRYDHLRTNSTLVSPGEFVSKGQKIAEVGSAGASTGPHLHFEVWGTGFYELADPWAGPCGPNFDSPLWDYQIPWGGAKRRSEMGDRNTT